MRKGLPGSTIKSARRQLGKGATPSQVMKKAWQLHRGDKRKTYKSPATKKKQRRKTVAKKKRRRRQGFTIPIAPVVGAIAPLAMTCPSGRTIIGDLMAGDINSLIYDARERFTGIDANGKFQISWVAQTYLPVIVGALVHKFVGGSPLNVNRMLARAGVPVIRI